jgi:hypothetical protein
MGPAPRTEDPTEGDPYGRIFEYAYNNATIVLFLDYPMFHFVLRFVIVLTSIIRSNLLLACETFFILFVFLNTHGLWKLILFEANIRQTKIFVFF